MLFFDLDGTLIDSNGIWVEVDLAFLGRHGLTPTDEYAYTVGHSIFPVAAQYTRDYYHMDLSTQEIMDEWLSMAADAYARVPLKPGAGEFLARCRDRGERMALVTACVPELCRSALAHHGLAEWFEAIFFAQDLGMEKRDPRVFTLTAQRLGVAPADCTLYEDAPANCAAAKGVGMTVVGVYDPFYENYQDQVRENSHRYLRSFTELLM